MTDFQPAKKETMPPRRLAGGAKFAVDFGPLGVFLIAYFFGRKLAPVVGNILGREFTLASGEELFLAVAAFLPAFALAFLYSVWKERRIAPMLLVSGVAIGVLGVLTLVLHNKTFFYMKPTIIYVMFAGMLLAGLATGRNFLKTLFDGALHMNDDAWRTLTKRYAIFFCALAIANEVAWRWLMRDCDLGGAAQCAGEPLWVNLKVFGFTGVNILFAAAHAPFIAKHMKEVDESAS
ncbi:MAG TPA: inner membrane-spanning protein YciB [Parvularculaceae bacterium]|nr:septation protein IspZ [Amphiplicatus sp.]MCB9956654.1 septation protein IspZ [Caulobacterales bacterium]HOP19227.1 inner membrane-spanning protein YciB [Amphiplicatus sp.]HPE31187.1 inner membrane-spanning protein YciB [Parvularculaceae bacterium]HRX39957.1 inner membrane-spanning protein YciB [Parvularculaceae bacterium]